MTMMPIWFGTFGASGEAFYRSLTTKSFTIGGDYVIYADRLTFATDTFALTTSANFKRPGTTSRIAPGAVGNSVKAIYAGGYDRGFVSYVNTVEVTTYSNDTTAYNSAAALTAGRTVGGSAGTNTKGFFAGGSNNSNLATAEKTTYDTETTVAVSGANLTTARSSCAGAGNLEKAFFSSGFSTPTDKITFSTETTVAATSANLTTARPIGQIAGNRDKSFYAGGGYETNQYLPYTRFLNTDRTTYATEVTAAVSGANLLDFKFRGSGTGTNNNGYFIGGLASYTWSGDTKTFSTNTQKISYATETVAYTNGPSTDNDNAAAA